MPSFSGTISPGGGTIPVIPGATPRNWDETYGGIPRVPSPGATSTAAISSNIGNLGSLYGLAGGINQFNEQSLLGNLAAGLPDYRALTGTSSGNILSELHGQLPADVMNLLGQQAAERGVATGQPTDSPNRNAAYLRALGLTSLDLTGRGENELTAAIGRTPMAHPFDISSMLTSPEQWQQAASAANLYASAPTPARAATAGIGAFDSGLGAGGRAVGAPGITPGGGGLGFGAPGDPFLDMYNAPDFGFYGGQPLTGSGVDTGTGEPNPQAYANWQAFASGLPMGREASGSYDPELADYTAAGTGEDYGLGDYYGGGD